MNLLRLSAKSLRAKPAATAVSLLLLSLGVAIISILFLLSRQVEEKFEKNIRGIDMVVGAKGSPLQLILSTVFQVDNPTGNINLQEAARLKRNRLVAKAIPLSYGDSYRGFRLIGTEPTYLELYNAVIAEGNLWQQTFEVVLGSRVARETNLKVGDSFYSAHGLMPGSSAHEDHPFRVVGILEAGNSVLDGLILTSLESVWAVHMHQEGSATAGKKEQDRKEITAMLIQFRGPMGMVMLPRQINEGTNMQAAVPSVEINRLFNLLGMGVNLLQSISYAIILIAGLSFFLSLYNSLRERKYEIALMRSMGASKTKVLSLLLLEGFLLGVLGYLTGIILGHLGLMVVSNLTTASFGYEFDFLRLTTEELLLAPGLVLVGLAAALFPAIKVLRTPIPDTLSDS